MILDYLNISLFGGSRGPIGANFTINDLMISAVVMVIALIVHNIVQTYVAARLGDSSAKFSGFNTFDPQQQLEPIGILFLFLFGYGWAKTIPTNSRSYGNRGKQEAWVWYSGPLTFLAFAYVCYFIAQGFAAAGQPVLAVSFGHAIRFLMLHAVINLLPVYPLDGAKGALAFGNRQVRQFVEQVQRFGLLGFIVVVNIFFILGITGAISNILLLPLRLIFGA